jgi:polysaccharide export outer membrane protein
MKNEATVKAVVVRLDRPVDNFLIEPLDKVYLFNLVDNRPQILSGFIDKLISQATYNEYPEIVTVHGSVEIPGVYPHYRRMTIQDLVRAARGVAVETDLDHAVLVRKIPNNSAIKTMLITLKDEDSLATILEPADKLYLFNIDGARAEVLLEVVNKLRQQVGAKELVPSVEIDGLVKKPGEYPLSNSMSVKDIVGLAGGLSYAAYDLDAEITRVVIQDNQEKKYEHFSISLQNTAETASVLLRPEDRVLIKRKPNWKDAANVTLSGEFQFPGSYQIKQGEMLSQVIKRAGGITEHAYSDGAVFTRLELRELEEKRLRDLESQLEKELTANSIQEEEIGKEKPDTAQVDKLLEKLKETKATGRMVIDLPGVLGGNSEVDVILKEGDTVFLPSKMQSVTVIGEVQHPTSHLIQRGRGVSDYIAQSGGPTFRADNSRVYIVKANGRVVQPKGRKWFFASNSDVAAGDTIVVPIQADRISTLKLWTDVTQIIYQVGLGAAAVGSL